MDAPASMEYMKPVNGEFSDSEQDVELPPPQQHVMLQDPQHAAVHYSPIGGGDSSLPAKSEQLYTKALCLVCSIASEVLGKMVIGCNTTCFCIKGTSLCGLGGPDGCPAANAGCDMYKPMKDVELSGKLLCCKVGVVNCMEDKPYCMIAKKEIF